MGNTASYKTMFRTADTVQRNSWYAIGDYTRDPAARMEIKGKNFILYLIATAIADFMGAYGAQATDNSFTAGNALMNKWLPLEPGQARVYHAVQMVHFRL